MKPHIQRLKDAMKLVIRRTQPKAKQAKMIREIDLGAKKDGWYENILGQLVGELPWQVAVARLMIGDYSWEGWGLRAPRDYVIPFDFPWYEHKKVKKLLVLSEQGLGDEILFASCFKDLLADEITVECEPRLVNVFSRSFPDMEFIPRTHTDAKGDKKTWYLDNSWADGREFDAMVLAGEIPTWTRRKLSDFPKEPYLKADPNPDYIGRVGVSWVGRQGGYPAEDFLPLYPDAISLQYNTAWSPFESPDIDLTNDIDGLFSLIAGLEKVVCVPTSVLHIAGAMGVPVDVVLPKRGWFHGGFDEQVHNGLNWRFRVDKKFPWHACVSVFDNWSDYEKNKRLLVA